MPRAMICLLPFLTANCQVRRLRISVPLVPALLDGQKYFLESDLAEPAGLDLRSAFRPRLFIGKPGKPSPDEVT